VAAAIERVSLSKVAKIEEDFTRKIVLITLDRQALRDKDISEKFVLQKIGEVAPDYSQDGPEVKIKLKDDSLKNIRRTTNALSEVILKGVQNINRVIVVEKKDRASGVTEYSLATEGTNLKDVLKVPGVDASRTTTNDIVEISRVLGIEAARNAIIQEIKKVLDAQDLRVDLRHVSLIADAMTFDGSVRSVGRHGIAGEKTSVLARAAFEETGKHLVHACVFGEEDKLSGVAENIIIGQTIPCGTGRVSLVMKGE
jgi:DNA-directed RNA polymerase subunit A"